MKKLLIKLAAFEAAFFLVLAPLVALAQSYPTPTFSSLTLQNPLAVSSGGTGTTTSTGTGSVVRGTSPTIASPTITGGFTATGLVTLPSLAAQAANTVVANVTGSSASPAAFAMPSCSSSTSALQWTSGTGFVCGSGFANLSGATFTGNLTVSNGLPAISLNDTTNTDSSSINFNKGGTTIWGIVANSSNSSFNLNRVVGGSYADTPFTISNTTGVVSMSDGLTAAGGINNTPIGATTPAAGTFTFVGVPSLVSGATQFTLGADPGQGGSVLWNSALSRIGGNLTLNSNLGNNSNDEFLTVIEANQQATSLITLTTTASTSTSSNVLTFSSVPATIKVGMAISDSTSVNAIQQLFVTATTATTVTMSGTPLSTVGSGDTIVFGFQNFKGPLYLGANCFDTSTYQFTRACNALTSFTTIQNGVTNGYAEGAVMTVNGTGTGDGLMIAGEFDIGPNVSSNSAHCDQSGISNCHTNLWLANFGAVRGSWMLDTASGGQGWNNGLALRNIAAGGLAVQVPNNTVIASTNASGSTIYNLIFAGTDNSVHVGSNATSVAMDAPLNVGSGGIVGVQDGSSAAADRVGEYPTPSNLTGVSLTSGTAANVASASLTAGDWDVQCTTVFSPNSSTSISAYGTGVSTTSATYGAGGTYQSIGTGSFTTSGSMAITSPMVRQNLSSTTTLYCVASSVFSTSTMTASGYLRARRVR
ncbi:hypothetical protein [Burkholderia cenocepacia]|uniref:hypothetical protein n=1 Tax=Burkholderia cenocepacia TaxID=95486 RepID=UPI002AAF4A2C|nr:hypothetical protein [Burkholderia cenocepacia]